MAETTKNDVNKAKSGTETAKSTGPSASELEAARDGERGMERQRADVRQGDIRPSESGDADVQNLLAQKQTAQLNGDTDEVKRIDDLIAGKTK